jgi:hypothetical protein
VAGAGRRAGGSAARAGRVRCPCGATSRLRYGCAVPVPRDIRCGRPARLPGVAPRIDPPARRPGTGLGRPQQPGGARGSTGSPAKGIREHRRARRDGRHRAAARRRRRCRGGRRHPRSGRRPLRAADLCGAPARHGGRTAHLRGHRPGAARRRRHRGLSARRPRHRRRPGDRGARAADVQLPARRCAGGPGGRRVHPVGPRVRAAVGTGTGDGGRPSRAAAVGPLRHRAPAQRLAAVAHGPGLRAHGQRVPPRRPGRSRARAGRWRARVAGERVDSSDEGPNEISYAG